MSRAVDQVLCLLRPALLWATKRTTANPFRSGRSLTRSWMYVSVGAVSAVRGRHKLRVTRFSRGHAILISFLWKGTRRRVWEQRENIGLLCAPYRAYRLQLYHDHHQTGEFQVLQGTNRQSYRAALGKLWPYPYRFFCQWLYACFGNIIL
jgi:hypothetical protein